MGDIQVTLLIGFFMLISYIWAKIPYGMTAVFCCLALETQRFFCLLRFSF